MIAPKRKLDYFVDIPLVQKNLSDAADLVGFFAAEDFRKKTDCALRNDDRLSFDSPLEVLFWVWWNSMAEMGIKSNDLVLMPQQDVSVSGFKYRVDFLIVPSPARAIEEWRPIAVEMDGHAFHERTPEQVASRDRRDRALQAAGWRVFHFSFREFTTCPAACVTEVFEFARGQFLAGSNTTAIGSI